MEPIRVLYINGGSMNRGGTESYMMNYYREMDTSKVQLDFVVHGFEKGAYDEEIKQLGGKMYHVPQKRKNYFGNIRALKKIFQSGEYQIVHAHMDAMNTFVLKTAKECGIPIRIAHSHNTEHLTNNRLKYALNEYARKRITKYATHYFACSEQAAAWLFGKEKLEKVTYIKNAINLEKYLFEDEIRQKERRELGMEDHFVIGHVGRLDYQKNHSYLLEVFREVLVKKPEARLVLVGDGHLRKEIEAKIREENLTESVYLAGVRQDVQRLMNAFDVFCFPSHFEGLGMVLIEAQANGLRCVTSTAVPEEADITGETEFLSTQELPHMWADAVLRAEKPLEGRKVEKRRFTTRGYSIAEEAAKLQNIYLAMGESREEKQSSII